MGDLPLRAVLCDDDATVRHVVRGVVEDCGFEVVGEAALALEALVLAEMTKAHVLVLDLSLKGVSGTDVIPAVRTAAPGTQIVVYTAFDTLARLAEEEGVADVVRKDEPEKLEAALRRVAAEHGHVVTHP
jgi:DNA-binding NarL/FixJ family response regulator